jgi:hypothetical protein
MGTLVTSESLYFLFEDQGTELGVVACERPDLDRGDVLPLDDGSVALVLHRINIPARTRPEISSVLHVARFGVLR